MAGKYISGILVFLILYCRLFAGSTDFDDLLSSADSSIYYNRFPEAHELSEKGLANAEALFGKNSKQYLEALNRAIRVHLLTGKYIEAKSLIETDERICKNTVGMQGQEFAAAKGFLGELYLKLGKTDSSIACYRESLNILSKLNPIPTVKISGIWNNLGSAYLISGDYDKALPLLDSSLTERLRLFPGGSIELCESYVSLGKFYQARGDFPKADSLFKISLSILKKLFTGSTSYMANTLYNLGNLYYEYSYYPEATPYLEESLDIYRKIFDGDHPEKANTINKLAELYDSRNKYEEAGKLYLEALDMRSRLYVEDHPDVAESLNNMAIFFDMQGNIDEAGKLYFKALEMNKRIYIGDHQSIALNLNNIGYFMQKLARLGDAEPYFREALNMYRRIYTGDHPDIVSSLNNLAYLYYQLSKYDSVETYYKESIAMLRRIGNNDNGDLAILLNNLANFYDNEGRYAEAEDLYNQSLAIYRRISPPEDPSLARTINNLGEFYNKLGRYSDAEVLFVEALGMYRKLFAEPHSELLASINSMASYYKEHADYSAAESLYKEALEIARNLYKTNNPNLAKTLNNVADFYEKQGRLDEAYQLYTEAYEISRSIYSGDNPELASYLNSIASVLMEKNDYTGAEKNYEEALAMRKRLFREGHNSIASSYGNLAYLYEKNGDTDKAELYHKMCLEIKRKNFNDDNIELANSLNSLGTFYMMNGRLGEAKPLLAEALAMARRLFSNNHPYLNYMFTSMGDYYNRTGSPDSANFYFSQAHQVINRFVGSYFPSLSDGEKTLFWESNNGIYKMFNSFTFSNYNKMPALAGEMFDNQLYTKAILLNSSKKVRERINSSRDTSLISQLRKWQTNREILASLYRQPVNSPQRLLFNIDSLELITNELEKQLSRKSELFSKEYEKAKLSWKDIRKCLKPGEAAVEIIRMRYFDYKPVAAESKMKKFTYTDSVIYAALIVKNTSSEYPEIVFLQNGNALESVYIKQYRKAIKFGIRDNYSYGAFWHEIDVRLGGINKVYVSADGVYNNLNLNTLYDDKKGSYIIDKYDVRLLTSTRDLVEIRNRKALKSGNLACLFGNPAYTDSLNTNKIINPLPGTLEEVNTISTYMKSFKWAYRYFTGNNAREDSIKKLINPKVLHIATHGLFLEPEMMKNTEAFKFDASGNPLMRSMLLLAGAEPSLFGGAPAGHPGDDGLLTAYEAMNLNLDETELVVLSACETGQGELKNGEGVYGLQRSFQVAGAQSLVMSLWNVNDVTTQNLMISFYGKWLSGKNKRQAFREAQLELKNTFPEPKYWGAFVMLGE